MTYYDDYTGYDDPDEPESYYDPVDCCIKTREKKKSPAPVDPTLYGVMHPSYSLPGYFNAHTMFRARPSEHYDIFWEMVKQTAHGLRWCLRTYPPQPCSAHEFKQKLPPAILHNFVHRHKRRFDWKDEDTELRKKARRCKFLPGSKAKYPCHQRQICPFCLCAESAVPLYETICDSLKRTEFSKPMLCHLTFFIPYQIRCCFNAGEAAEKLLCLRQGIRDTRTLRAVKDKWFRLCLVGEDESSLQAALRCLMIVDRSDLDRVINRLDRFQGFIPSTFRAYPPEQIYINQHTGWFYHNPKRLLRTPFSEIEPYLHPRIYATRVRI